MKSKLNDAELIAEAYSKVEVQEEALGALAAGIGAGARTAATNVGKALTSDGAKKVYRAAGKGAKKAAETVGGAALGAASGAAGGIAKAAAGVAQGAVEGAVGAVQGAVDGATGGIGAAARGAGENMAGHLAGDEEGEQETKALEVKVADAKAKGDIDSSDAASIMRGHYNREDHESEEGVLEGPAPANHADDSEMKMALAELYKIEKYAFALGLMMKELPALEGWTAAKITKAADYLGSVFHKLDYDFASGEHEDKSMFNKGYEDAAPAEDNQ